MRDAFATVRPRRVAVAVAFASAAALLGLLIPSQPSVALGLGVLFLVFGFVLSAPSLLLVSVFATTYAYWRVGPSFLNMSVTDAVTVLAILAAAPYVPWKRRGLRKVLLGLAVYLALLSVSVLANPTQRAIAEYFHRAVLFGGTVVVGAAVAHRHQIASALRAFIFASAIIAVGAIFDSLTHGLAPAYPFTLHKNLAGSLLATGVIVLVVAPWRLELRPPLIRHLRVLLVVGLLATQSRGAALALVAVTLIYVARHRSARQRAPIFFLIVTLTLIIGSAITLKDEYKSNPKFNGIDSRTSYYDYAINNVWLVHPIEGGGLRWFQASGDTSAGVHNLVLAELSEAGLIGFAGLLILVGNTVVVLVRRRDPIGEAAFLVFAFEVLFGLTEIFWVAGTLSLAMLMVGLAVGEDVEQVALTRRGLLSPAEQ